MNQLIFFYVINCGLLFTVLGISRLCSAFRAKSGPGLVGEPASESAAVVGARKPRSLWKGRIRGLAWLFLGIVLLWTSPDPDSWGLATVGLLAYVMRLRLGKPPRVVSHQGGQESRLAEIVTQQVERAFGPNGQVGLVVGAVAKGEETLMGYGTREFGGWQPPDGDTVFEIGSITKVFTGILLAQEVERGELGLDDRVSDRLPEGWSLSESARGITLRHCTTHTSGFPRLPANLLGVSSVLRLVFAGRDPYRDYSEGSFSDALASVELRSEPGTRYRYSNFGVGLLGFVLAKRHGSDYETLVTSRICQPLGMLKTVITADDWHREHTPAEYRISVNLGPMRLAAESEEWRLPNHLAGAGAIRSTGHDMMTFLKANMGLIPTPLDSGIRRSHQALFQENASFSIGMNWIRSFESSLSQTILWHNGGTGGFRTYLGFTEDYQYGVFALSNTANSVDSLAVDILKSLAREYSPGLPTSPAKPD
ncbi:serine hydrolase domain-containing protein [Singulisphaera rosea]